MSVMEGLLSVPDANKKGDEEEVEDTVERKEVIFCLLKRHYTHKNYKTRPVCTKPLP